MAGKVWTEEERQVIRDNHNNMTCKEMAILLPGRTTRAVLHEFSNMGLERQTPKVGEVFERLTVRNLCLRQHHQQQKAFAKCDCSCGGTWEGLATRLSHGTTKSCGCLKVDVQRERAKERNTTHGLSKHPLYGQYKGMVARCIYPSTKHYKNYGGRGIKVCDDWISSFESFYKWAMENGWEKGLTIEREDTNGTYCPENCCFATCKEQANNKRSNRMITAFGETKTLAMWTEDPRCNTNYIAIHNRIGLLGWEPERAISTPTRPLRRVFR